MRYVLSLFSYFCECFRKIIIETLHYLSVLPNICATEESLNANIKLTKIAIVLRHLSRSINSPPPVVAVEFPL